MTSCCGRRQQFLENRERSEHFTTDELNEMLFVFYRNGHWLDDPIEMAGIAEQLYSLHNYDEVENIWRRAFVDGLEPFFMFAWSCVRIKRTFIK